MSRNTSSGTIRATSTTPSWVVLFDASSTANASATGAMELPSSDTACPVKNQRKAGRLRGELTRASLRITRGERYAFAWRRKMVLLRLSSQALSRSRFALSPLAETVASMILLAKAQMANPWLAEWHDRHHADFASAVAADPFAAGLVRLLSSTRWLPAFVTVPPPGSMRTTLADELPAVAAVDDEMVLAELTRS